MDGLLVLTICLALSEPRRHWIKKGPPCYRSAPSRRSEIGTPKRNSTYQQCSVILTTLEREWGIRTSELKANLITIFVESTFYGLFLCLYAISNIILFRGWKQRKLNIPLISVTFGMFCFATIHVINNSIHRALSTFLAPTPADGMVFLDTHNNPSNIINSTIYIAQTLLADAFLIYRLFIVWGNNRSFIAPFLVVYLGCAAAGIGGIVAFAVPTPTAHNGTTLFSPAYTRWLNSFAGLTIFTNLMCALLIAGKIWWIKRKASSLSHLGGRNLATPMVLIIESGAFYSFCLVVQLISDRYKSFLSELIVRSMPSVIAFTFSLIIVRLGLGLSSFEKDNTGLDSGTPNPARTPDFATSLSNHTGGSSSRGAARQRAPFSADDGHHCQTCQCGNTIAMRPLEVRISKKVDSNTITLECNDTDSSTSKTNTVDRGDAEKLERGDAQV